MEANAGQPPPQKKKKKNPTSALIKKQKKDPTSAPSRPSFSSLPDELLLNFLSRTSKSQYRVLSVFYKSIRSLVFSPELYAHRARLGNTEPCLYLYQEFPSLPDRWFTLDRTLVTDGWIKDELSLSPITPSSSAHPIRSTKVAAGFEIYLIGGTINKRPSSAVGVLDCRTHTWRDAPNMTVPRKRPRTALFKDGKIYVYGDTEVKELLWTGEVFDLKTQVWSPLPPLPLGHHHMVGPWCVIENVYFCVCFGAILWLDIEPRRYYSVKGLEALKPVICYDISVKLANYGGKLVVMWPMHEKLEFPVAGKTRKYLCKNKKIWCAVIRLEKRNGPSGLEIFGDIERLNTVLTVPSSYKIFSCITL